MLQYPIQKTKLWSTSYSSLPRSLPAELYDKIRKKKCHLSVLWRLYDVLTCKCISVLWMLGNCAASTFVDIYTHTVCALHYQSSFWWHVLHYRLVLMMKDFLFTWAESLYFFVCKNSSWELGWWRRERRCLFPADAQKDGTVWISRQENPRKWTRWSIWGSSRENPFCFNQLTDFHSFPLLL